MRYVRSWLTITMAVVSTLAGSGPAWAAAPFPPPSGSAGSPRSYGNPAFATPEDAVRHYLAGIAAGDAGMVLEATAVDDISTGFRFAQSVDRVQSMILTTGLAPAEYPLFSDMDRVFSASQILFEAKMLVYSLLSTETIDGSTIAPADKARADAFVAQVDPSRLAGLTVLDIRYPNAKWEHDEKNLKNEASYAAIYGADGFTQRVALVSLDGNLYEVGFSLLRYGDRWGISDQVAPLGDTTVLGAAVPITLEEYGRHTSGE